MKSYYNRKYLIKLAEVQGNVIYGISFMASFKGKSVQAAMKKNRKKTNTQQGN